MACDVPAAEVILTWMQAAAAWAGATGGEPARVARQQQEAGLLQPSEPVLPGCVCCPLQEALFCVVFEMDLDPALTRHRRNFLSSKSSQTSYR